MVVCGILMVIWNFYELGYGKGVFDGVGGILKWMVNWKVLYGRDIKDVIFFKEMLEEEKLNILVFYVFIDMVEEKCKLFLLLKFIFGIMKIY